MNRLAKNYFVDQVENFIRDIGLIFTRILSEAEWYKAALGANSNKGIYMLYLDKSNAFASSEAKSYLRYNNVGLNEIFLDDIDNQWTTHYHVAYMMTGYYLGELTEILLYGREIIWERNNYGDYYLGIVGAYQGMLLKNNPAMIENINLFFDVLGE